MGDSPAGGLNHSSCMCGGVQGTWVDEYPFVQQGVMHSPIGCLRHDLQTWEMQELLKEITGYTAFQGDKEHVYKALMETLGLRPQLAVLLRCVVTPVPHHPAREFSPPVTGNQRGGTRVGGASKTQPAKRQYIVENPGPIKPPWEK